MVTNLPPEARAKWIKVMEAKSSEEKLRALEEFLSAIPKHKGTENLVHWVRRRIAQLRREIEEKKIKERSVRSGSGLKFYIEKEGDIQLVIIGPPSSGKSSLLKNTMAIALARNADGVIIQLDATMSIKKQLERILSIFRLHGIHLSKPKAAIRIERKHAGGIQIIGKLCVSPEDVKKLLQDYGIRNALVTIEGEASIEDIEEAIIREYVYKPSIVMINKIDQAFSGIDDEVRELEKNFTIIKTSLIKCRIDYDEFLEKIMKTLDLIRIFTKEPHNVKFSDKPFIVKRGVTVGELARMLHSKLYKNFKYAKIWRVETFPNYFKRVGLDYVLNDGDVIEIRTQ
ncbi:MAG: GTP-binding protein [Thermoprotei archaeon ex4572_64]|nr:MAG: GTP-binding protein [Thermoprotei archaeon ex4572_64]